MNNDPGIICVKHCNSVIFAFNCPEVCPTCQSNFISSSVYPFRIPFPFTRASQSPCSLVLKPTNGDFLRDYRNTQDLHIGLTNSKGKVYAYDETGLNILDDEEWNQCLAIPSYTSPMELDSIEDIWDQNLNKIYKSNVWNSDRYSEENLNCYSFVLSFLQTINLGEFSKSAENKSKFCNEILINHTTSAAKYITIYRNVCKNNIFIQSNNCNSSLK